MLNELKKDLKLSGEKIYLRAVAETDVNEHYLHWLNDPEVTRLTVGRYSTHTLDSLKEYVLSKSVDCDVLFLAMVLNEGDRHVGNIKLGPIDWEKSTGDIGLLIGEKNVWGQGVGTEAIGLITEFAFKVLKLKRVTAGYFSDNIGSSRAFIKNHFYYTGKTVEDYSKTGDVIEVTWLAREHTIS